MLNFFDDNFTDEFLTDSAQHEASTMCFVIEIKNNNPITLQNIEVGNATENLHKENLGLPPNVTVTVEHKTKVDDKETTTTLTYGQYLNKNITDIFKVGLIYFQEPTGAYNNELIIQLPFQEAKKLTALLDPYRMQHTSQRYAILFDFFINGKEKIIIPTIKPKHYCKLHLYRNLVAAGGF